MAKFRGIKTLQKFASVHASIHNHFNLGLCQTNANQVEFVIPGFRWTAQNSCDFQQPLGD